jgi:hypothetical protein
MVLVYVLGEGEANACKSGQSVNAIRVETYLALICMLTSQITSWADCLHNVLGRPHFGIMVSGPNVFACFFVVSC